MRIPFSSLCSPSKNSRPIRSHASLFTWGGAGFLMLLAGCARVGPDYRTPPVPVASNWIEPENNHIKSQADEHAEWWKAFNDPTLEKLIHAARTQNLPLRIAGLRVLEARAQRGLSAGAFWPQLQQITGSYSRIELGEQLSQGGGPKAAPKRRFDVNSLGADAAWELDLWGKFRRAIESSDANLLASIYSYEDVLVTLAADVATTYVDVRTFEERLRLAESNVKIQNRTMEITEAKFKNGAVAELDVQQAKANLTNTQAFIPLLKNGKRLAQNRLCVLLGIPAQDLGFLLGESSTIPQPPAEVAIGLPAHLIRRRPDVRNAERQAAAQSAQIGVAFADLLPQISLRGSIGVSANQSNNLFMGNAVASSFGPNIRWDILNYGRIRSNVRVQDARLEQLLVNYENTVIAASAEVENSLSSYLRSIEQVEFLGKSVAAAERAVELANTQYRDGAIDFIRLLNSEAFLVQQQDTWTSRRSEVGQHLITLYRALGGGWQLRLGHEFVPPETIERMKKRTHWGNIVDSDFQTKTDLLWPRPKPQEDRERELRAEIIAAPAANAEPAEKLTPEPDAGNAKDKAAGVEPAKPAKPAKPVEQTGQDKDEPKKAP